VTLPLDGYAYTVLDFAKLLIMKHYPERTDGESAVIRAYLLEHLTEYDRVQFSVRIGTPVAPDPTHLETVQANTVFSSKLRIDILGWQGQLPTIVEVKQRVTPPSLGQILTYRKRFIEEFPDAPEPRLVVVGREAVEDAVAALQHYGVTVLLYPDADPRANDAANGL